MVRAIESTIRRWSSRSSDSFKRGVVQAHLTAFIKGETKTFDPGVSFQLACFPARPKANLARDMMASQQPPEDQ